MADGSFTFGNLSSTESAAANGPQGSTTIGSNLDENLRFYAAHIAAWRDETGWGTLILTSVAGTNTITATLATAGSVTFGPTSYITGARFLLVPANTNTGATTLNITSPNGGSALGAKNVLLNGQALAGGELLATVPCVVEYDGTSFHIVANAYKRLKVSPTAAGKNIAARTNSGTPNTKLDITADELILTNSTGNAIRVTSVSGTIDFGTTGANGLDTGTQQVSTWYYGYVIAKEDGTVAVLGSASSSAPTMPSGYTFKALVTAARSNGSTQFLKYRQFGNRCYYEARQSVLASGSGTTETAVSTATLVPPIAEAFGGDGNASFSLNAGDTNMQIDLRVVSGSNFQSLIWTEFGVGSAHTYAHWLQLVDTPNISQNFYYIWTTPGAATSLSLNISITSFKLPVGGE